MGVESECTFTMVRHCLTDRGQDWGEESECTFTMVRHCLTEDRNGCGVRVHIYHGASLFDRQRTGMGEESERTFTMVHHCLTEDRTGVRSQSAHLPWYVTV